jgi:hypothetical protein
MTNADEGEGEVVLAFEPRKPGRRRSYTAEQKRLLLEEARIAATLPRTRAVTLVEVDDFVEPVVVAARA